MNSLRVELRNVVDCMAQLQDWYRYLYNVNVMYVWIVVAGKPYYETNGQTGKRKKAFESIVSEREEGDGAEGEAKPGRWAYADEVGGAARFLAKDGAGGGEARFSGLWRSIDSGALRPLCRVRSLAVPLLCLLWK